MSTIHDVQVSDILSAASAFKSSRTTPRTCIPFVDSYANITSGFPLQPENGLVIADENIIIALDRDNKTDDGLKQAFDKIEKAHNNDHEATENTSEGEVAGIESNLKRDVIVWVPSAGEAGKVVVWPLGSGYLFVGVSSDTLPIADLVGLAATFQKAVVDPFTSQGGRLEWYRKRKPTVMARSEITPSSGEFDITFSKRLDSLLKSANGRVSAAYDKAFDQKVLNTARSAVGRVARKCELETEWGSKGKKAKDENENADVAGAGAT